jgi:RecB family exonuclease
LQEQDGTCVDVNVDEAGFKIVVDVVVDIGPADRIDLVPMGGLVIVVVVDIDN